MATHVRRLRQDHAATSQASAARSAHGRFAGRPPRVYRALLEELSARALREMWEVVTTPDHPWHAEHGPKMLRDLVRICTPRIGHVGVYQANDLLEVMAPQPSMAELFEADDQDRRVDRG